MDFFISVIVGCECRQRVAGQAAQINISGFLVLSIPMNLPQSRKRVRQWAPRFREFISIAQKEPFHIHLCSLHGDGQKDNVDTLNQREIDEHEAQDTGSSHEEPVWLA